MALSAEDLKKIDKGMVVLLRRLDGKPGRRRVVAIGRVHHGIFGAKEGDYSVLCRVEDVIRLG